VPGLGVVALSPFKDWFFLGPFGPCVAVPRNLLGWLTTLGLTLPALIYAFVGGGLGRLLAAGLFAFLFGFSYAIADERRGGKADAPGPPATRADPRSDTTVDEAPLAA